jgi:L-asparaginase
MIATGGTIASKIDPVKNAPVPALSGQDLIALVPGLDRVARVQVENLFNVPSDYMDPERWAAIRKSVVKALADEAVAGVIVSHGTDTLEETAYFLDLTVAADKPVVLVGSQRNASEPDFDGPRNLLNAARICISPYAHGKGVMIALNNQIAAQATRRRPTPTFGRRLPGYLGVVDGSCGVRRTQATNAAEGRPPPATSSPCGAPMARPPRGRQPVQRHRHQRWSGHVNVLMFEAIEGSKGVVVVVSTWSRGAAAQSARGGGKTLRDAGAVFADTPPEGADPRRARCTMGGECEAALGGRLGDAHCRESGPSS